MMPRHYDLIVLGESLAGQIAAALLARGGRRVLLLGEKTGDGDGAPFPACLHLQRVLEQLDGRACLRPSPPRQVLSGSIRLTLHGSTPLPDELQREFGADAARVARLLTKLQRVGLGLEAALQQSGGLPLGGFGSRWRFAWRRLRRGLTRRALARPLDRHLQGLGSESRAALAALFAGLALLPPGRLSTAEAALLWSAVATGPGVDPAELAALLQKRFPQFRGERGALAELESVDGGKGRIGSIALTGGIRCTADTFLLASAAAADHFPVRHPVPAGQTAPGCVAYLAGGVSPLLAPAITLGGAPVLQLRLTPEGERHRLHVSTLRGTPPPTAEEIEERLAALFPFAAVDLVAVPATPAATVKTAPSRGARSFPGAAGVLPIGPNLLLCSGDAILPGLGPTGEVLVGTSVAALLQRKEKE
jgi:hypothetical protein